MPNQVTKADGYVLTRPSKLEVREARGASDQPQKTYRSRAAAEGDQRGVGAREDRSATGIRARCICGGRGVRWPRRGRCCSRNWWMIHRRCRNCSPARRRRRRSVSVCSRSSRSWCCGRTPPTRGCWKRRGWRSAGAGAGRARRTATTRARPSCSTRTGCRPSTTRSPAAGPSPWRRSGWVWRATPATSTRWRC